MNGPAIDPRQLRVSDDERSHVLRLLEKATGRGLIDLADYNERSARVIAARTREDLNSVLLDLPGLQIAGRTLEEAIAVTGPPGYSGPPPSPGSAPSLELTGWGSRSFKGNWSVPASIVIGGMGASTRLDFSTATLTSRRVTIEFRSNYGGSCELICPRGTSVTYGGLAMQGGSLNNRIEPGGTGVLDLILVGVKKAGSIVLRHPKQGWFSGRH